MRPTLCTKRCLSIINVAHSNTLRVKESSPAQCYVVIFIIPFLRIRNCHVQQVFLKCKIKYIHPQQVYVFVSYNNVYNYNYEGSGSFLL